jgi:hypothetical protein
MNPISVEQWWWWDHSCSGLVDVAGPFGSSPRQQILMQDSGKVVGHGAWGTSKQSQVWVIWLVSHSPRLMGLRVKFTVALVQWVGLSSRTLCRFQTVKDGRGIWDHLVEGPTLRMGTPMPRRGSTCSGLAACEWRLLASSWLPLWLS